MKKKLLMTAGVITLAGMFAFGEVDALTVQVNKGDTLYSIAKKNNVSLDALKKENKLTSNTIYVGQKLTIPGKGTTTTPSPSTGDVIMKREVKVGSNDVLNVRSGPGVSNGIIGSLKNKAVVEIYSLHGEWAKIKYGTKTGYVHRDYLREIATTTPTTPPPVVETPKTGTTYTVVKGDTLYRIGIKFGVSYQDIKKWSNISSDELKVGQVLVVSEPGKTPTTPPKEETPTTKPDEKPSQTTKPDTYVVKSGDYLFKIANETGVSVASIKALNNLTSDTIYVGQVLKLSKSLFLNPAPGVLTSTYGQRWGAMHLGIDIAKAGIVPIVAAYDGKVIRAQWNDGWGNYVVIEHVINGQKYASLYGHMRNDSLKVKVGDTVKQGQQIGLMGTTGNSTGQHLHLEFYVGEYNYGKTNVNPLDYFAY